MTWRAISARPQDEDLTVLEFGPCAKHLFQETVGWEMTDKGLIYLFNQFDSNKDAVLSQEVGPGLGGSDYVSLHCVHCISSFLEIGSHPVNGERIHNNLPQ
jgi:hypothetical protein